MPRHRLPLGAGGNELRTMTLKVKALSIIISKDVYVPEKGPFWIEDQAHPNLLVHIYQNNDKETRF